MLGKIVLGVSALLAVVNAETAPGFPIQVAQRLEVAYGNNTVSPPGERIPRPGRCSLLFFFLGPVSCRGGAVDIGCLSLRKSKYACFIHRPERETP
ncbi:hypothetical protein IQ07DRAFT_590991 [Pyrenochaeta sp. DS3sAY3a]|nr:hypothetical protein IQ07DRAFT_590991 [Pyrenochaeta sp. DS3sAY3a]